MKQKFIAPIIIAIMLAAPLKLRAQYNLNDLENHFFEHKYKYLCGFSLFAIVMIYKNIVSSSRKPAQNSSDDLQKKAAGKAKAAALAAQAAAEAVSVAAAQAAQHASQHGSDSGAPKPTPIPASYAAGAPATRSWGMPGLDYDSLEG